VHSGRWDGQLRPDDEWVVWNAPRPLIGERTWTGKFRVGTLYVAARRSNPMFDTWEAANRRDDAREIRVVDNADALRLLEQAAADRAYSLREYLNSGFAENELGILFDDFRLPWEPGLDQSHQPLLAEILRAGPEPQPPNADASPAVDGTGTLRTPDAGGQAATEGDHVEPSRHATPRGAPRGEPAGGRTSPAKQATPEPGTAAVTPEPRAGGRHPAQDPAATADALLLQGSTEDPGMSSAYNPLLMAIRKARRQNGGGDDLQIALRAVGMRARETADSHDSDADKLAGINDPEAAARYRAGADQLRRVAAALGPVPLRAKDDEPRPGQDRDIPEWPSTTPAPYTEMREVMDANAELRIQRDEIRQDVLSNHLREDMTDRVPGEPGPTSRYRRLLDAGHAIEAVDFNDGPRPLADAYQAYADAGRELLAHLEDDSGYWSPRDRRRLADAVRKCDEHAARLRANAHQIDSDARRKPTAGRGQAGWAPVDAGDQPAPGPRNPTAPPTPARRIETRPDRGRAPGPRRGPAR
jgi:hypothetical protein